MRTDTGARAIPPQNRPCSVLPRRASGGWLAGMVPRLAGIANERKLCRCTKGAAGAPWGTPARTRCRDEVEEVRLRRSGRGGGRSPGGGGEEPDNPSGEQSIDGRCSGGQQRVVHRRVRGEERGE